MKNMERREFLKTSVAGGIGMLSFKMTKADDSNNSSKEKFELEEATV